jgi:hypothetical protein
MKIKTVIFWTLWVGNNLTLQSVNGDYSEPASQPLFPDDFEDTLLLCRTSGLNPWATESTPVRPLSQTGDGTADDFHALGRIHADGDASTERGGYNKTAFSQPRPTIVRQRPAVLCRDWI